MLIKMVVQSSCEYISSFICNISEIWRYVWFDEWIFPHLISERIVRFYLVNKSFRSARETGSGRSLKRTDQIRRNIRSRVGISCAHMNMISAFHWYFICEVVQKQDLVNVMGFYFHCILLNQACGLVVCKIYIEISSSQEFWELDTLSFISLLH